MPLIILGGIVVVGGLLLLYFQLGPKITQRLKGGTADFTAKANEWFGEEPFRTEGSDSADAAADGDDVADGAGKTRKSVADDDGKVLFIFGGGEREERPLNDGK